MVDSTYQHKEKQKMGSAEEKIKTGGIINGAQTNLLEEMKLLKEFQDQSGTEGNKLGAVVRLCRSASFLAPGWKSGVLFPSRTQ